MRNGSHDPVNYGPPDQTAAAIKSASVTLRCMATAKHRLGHSRFGNDGFKILSARIAACHCFGWSVGGGKRSNCEVERIAQRRKQRSARANIPTEVPRPLRVMPAVTSVRAGRQRGRSDLAQSPSPTRAHVGHGGLTQTWLIGDERGLTPPYFLRKLLAWQRKPLREHQGLH